MYISPYCRLVLVPPIFMEFGIRGQLTDAITYVKFLVDRFRDYGILTPPKLPFPIDLLRRPYNSVALPCDTVIIINDKRMMMMQVSDDFINESSSVTSHLLNENNLAVFVDVTMRAVKMLRASK